jgi:O-methyltransferase
MTIAHWRTELLRSFARRLSTPGVAEAAAAAAEPAADASAPEPPPVAASASMAEPTPADTAEPVPPPSDFAAYASYFSPLKTRLYADFDDAEKEIYLRSYGNLCGSPEAIVSLIRAVHYVIKNDMPGAFVECGVFMGGNIEVMIRALQQLGVSDRDIFLYDTFAGMPRPDVVDDLGPDGEIKRAWEANRTDADGDAGSDWMRAGVDLVRQRLEPLGYPPERLHFVKGLVEDTIPGAAPGEIALLRLDTDFYASTKHEMVHLYPRLREGGILILDDYGAMPGCRRAIDEYAREHRLDWFLNRVDAHVRLVVKPVHSLLQRRSPVMSGPMSMRADKKCAIRHRAGAKAKPPIGLGKT